MPDLLEVCERAARAGGVVLQQWHGRFEVHEKGPDDLVTEVDLASQKAIVEVVRDAFPEHGILAEEALDIAATADGHRWIIDPLDGTLNFVHGLPNYCVSVAVACRDTVVVGVVYDPVADVCYSARRGDGAQMNGRPLRVSPTRRLSKALVAASFPAHVCREDIEIEQFVEAVVRSRGIRRLGSAALNLCHLAARHFDAYWATETHAWDIAAGMLLVEEAGGCFTGLHGEPVDLQRPQFVAAATPELHREVIEMLAEVAERRSTRTTPGAENA